MKGYGGLLTVAAAGLLLVGNAVSAAANDFYAGKTIRFIVGYAPGGGYDTYTRAIARHIGKHIPGNPTAVVDNMEGAGSLLGGKLHVQQSRSRRTHGGQISIAAW